MHNPLKSPLIIRHGSLKRLLVPQDPARERPRRVGLIPILAHSAVAINIAGLPCGILVLGIVGHSGRTERNDLFSPIPLKNRVELLFRTMRFTNRLEAQHSNISNTLEMAAPVIVNASTSAVLIDTSQLGPPNPFALVYLSSIPPGRTITVRDSTGYLSTPQSIVVSTTTGISYADGTSSITITQPYGYLSVTSRDATTWTLTNSFGFPQYQTIASLSALSTQVLATVSMETSSLVAGAIEASSIVASNSLLCYGQAQYSTLVIGAPYTLLPGTTTTIYGNVRSGPATFGGSLSAGPISTGNVLAGAISCSGYLTLGTDLTLGGNLIAPNTNAVLRNIITNSATVGALTVSSSMSVGDSLTVANTISTSAVSTGTLYVGSQINTGNISITPIGSNLIFSGGLITPSISTGNITASNAITTNSLYLRQSLIAPNLSVMQLGSAEITNPNGSLTLSSLVANTMQTTAISTNTVSTSLVQGSTLVISGNIDLPTTGYLTIGNVTCENISSIVLYSEIIAAQIYSINTLSVTNLNLTGNFNGLTLTELTIPNASIVSKGLECMQLTTSTMYTSSLNIYSGSINSPNSLVIDASYVSTTSISAATMVMSTLNTSTIISNKIILGEPVDPTLRGPYFVCFESTNCIITGGPGDYVSPLFLSNVKPPGWPPNTPYEVSARFRYIIPTPTETLPGNLVDVQNTLFWGGNPSDDNPAPIELNTNSFLFNETGGSVNLYGYYAEFVQTSNAQLIQQNSALDPGYTWFATMYNDSRATLTLQSLSNANYSLADYGTYINMQNGVLKWNYALNGTTIQNSLNDISTRNLIYYGSLNYASDPRLKRNVESADLGRCYSTIRDIPLRRYAFCDAYVSTFMIDDVHRIGIIADEYEEFFPKSITTQVLPGFSTIKTVDMQQLEMAHLGATQYLLNEVAELRSTLHGRIQMTM